MPAITAGFFRKVGRNFIDYWRTIGNDYRIVAKETFEACVKKPAKAGIYATGISGLVYAYVTNPSEASMLDELCELRQTMTTLPASIHNKESDAELAERSILLSQDRLHYYNLWFFSLLVRSEHDSSVKIYESQDKNLKDWIWNEFFKNIYDVGFQGRWYRLSQKFKDYDINQDELAHLPD
ncbi:unnamed protein product [Angiostrongylus costaricensis]|uniref:Mitochondrial import inner membrane translocase subunit Tim29 n=1 Tax=Angiostrongylus costaricensis TaxID=334426 RepID=A0A0R3PRT7_ANGCS|nr:unnamed protein product [Angiostrongylus costaricensis]